MTGMLVTEHDSVMQFINDAQRKKDEDVGIDCDKCSYKNYWGTAKAICPGIASKEECVHYLKNLVKELQEELSLEKEAKEYKERHDVVTGIYNSHEFFKAVNDEMRLHPHKNYYMVAADIRDFKLVNDLFGYEQGDLVLMGFADILRLMLANRGIFGRITGDRFGLFMEKDVYNEKAYLKTILTFENNLAIDGIKVFVQAGVCEVDDNTMDAATLYDKATFAINEIKNSYSQKIGYYRDEMRKNVIRAQRMVSEFDSALGEGQFQIYLQPQYSAKEEIVKGGEALVRWKHPDYGMISPEYFIPVFEDSGLICALDQYVWRMVCEKLSEWKMYGKDNFYISVNVSPHDFRSLDLYKVFTELVEEYDISPANLKLEITETAVLTDLEVQLHVIEKLKTYGFTVEMDDFGSGYSSLNMLKDINVNTLKIDMMFLGKTANEKKRNTILETMIHLSKQLGMKVITEGVETQEQVQFLKENGCDYFQGYYYSKPMPMAEFEEKFVFAK